MKTYEPHYDATGRIVWQRVGEDEPIKPHQHDEAEKLPPLNRRGRRKFKMAVYRAAQRHIKASMLRAVCFQCNSYFLGSPKEGRCGCKARTRRNNGL